MTRRRIAYLAFVNDWTMKEALAMRCRCAPANRCGRCDEPAPDTTTPVGYAWDLTELDDGGES